MEVSVCHRFEMVSGEEADAVVDWLYAVRRAVAFGAGVASVPPLSFGRPAEVPLEAIDCYPGAESPVIIAEGDELRRADLAWGVEVPWKRGLVFNARIESALGGSGMWHKAMEQARCIVPVRAFYETRNVDAPSGRRPQYRFSARGSEALLLAGLRLGDRFVLVTCEPDAVVGAVHTRMPLSLTAPEALAWLNAAADARALLDRHAPVPLVSAEEPVPAQRPKRSADPDQLSLF